MLLLSVIIPMAQLLIVPIKIYICIMLCDQKVFAAEVHFSYIFIICNLISLDE